MPADRLLNTVLEHLQTVHDDTKTDQIAGSTTTLLATLHNPLNLGVLTSQLLTSPAIWRRGDGLRAAVRVLSIYNSAALRVRQSDADRAAARHQQREAGLGCDAWTRGVVQGADARSSRWQHLLVLTGVLVGMDGAGDGHRPTISRSLRSTLQDAVVTAANLALERPMQDGVVGAASLVFALSYAFPLLDEWYKAALNCDALLPLLVWAATADEGFARGDFLRGIDSDLRQVGGRLVWRPEAPSFQRLRAFEARPLMLRMGPVAVMAAFAVRHVRSPAVVVEALDGLVEFSSGLLRLWQANTLSDVDRAAEPLRISADTLQGPWPALWLLLQKALYSVILILEAVVARGLLDPHLRNSAAASSTSTKVLRALRALFFISSRPGNSSSEAYMFTYLASLDVLSRFPDASAAFLAETQPPTTGYIPRHALARTLDLYHLNISEHLPLNLPPAVCDRLIVQPALVYLAQTAGSPTAPGMVELFESAHSAVLAVMSCPDKGSLAADLVPFYVDRLFAAFPTQISPRQFRLAFKTVMRIVAPPGPIAATHPLLAETLMEMVQFRAAHAGTDPLPPGPDAAQGEFQDGVRGLPEPLSEQSALVLTLVDSLPFLPLPAVDEWLTLTAGAVNAVADPVLREPARRRLWDILVSGELDVERAALGVAWWGTRGGRELVLQQQNLHELPLMSGAIAEEATSSRL